MIFEVFWDFPIFWPFLTILGFFGVLFMDFLDFCFVLFFWLFWIFLGNFVEVFDFLWLIFCGFFCCCIFPDFWIFLPFWQFFDSKSPTIALSSRMLHTHGSVDGALHKCVGDQFLAVTPGSRRTQPTGRALQTRLPQNRGLYFHLWKHSSELGFLTTQSSEFGFILFFSLTLIFYCCA